MGSSSSVLVPPSKRTLAEVVTDQLRDAIFKGHFAPGQLLSEEQLAKSLGISRGPIRDALARLEREGLIATQAHRRGVVAKLSHRDLEEVYTLRLALERLAVQYAILNGQPENFAAMENIVNALVEAAARGITEQEAAALDIGFHDLLYHAARHQRLLNAWSNIRSQVYVFLLSRNLANPDFRERVIIHGHSDISTALRDRDEKRALESIEIHLRAAYTRILQNYPGADRDEEMPLRSPPSLSAPGLMGQPIR